MSLFRKDKIGDKGFLSGMTDAHSHILPGVDDGVRHMSESLEILSRYEQLGIGEVWCTPHIMEDVPNETEKLRARFEELKAAYDGPIALHLAAEYMMDHLFDQRLAACDLLDHGGDGVRTLLVETSTYDPPMRFDNIMDEIKSKGFFPILAHPERYYYIDDLDDYKRMHEKGIRFQLNLGSMAGMYGQEPLRKAKWLLSHGMYSYVGSDLHSRRMLDMILAGRSFDKIW